MIYRTMRLKAIATPVLAVVLGLLLWIAGPAAVGRRFSLWEVLLVSGLGLVALTWWREHRRKQQRERLEKMRDSALW